MSAAQLVSRLALAGIDQSLLADVAQELFAAEIERKALADRRQNERERKAKSRDSTGQRVTGRERRGPPKEKNIKTPSSEANASGGAPPADPIKQVFDLGIAILIEAGTAEKQARGLLGKWRKAKGDGEVLIGLLECRAKATSDPIPWLEKRFAVAKWVSKSGYEYRGTDEAVLRECQRRNDMDTYWRVKGALKREAA